MTRFQLFVRIFLVLISFYILISLITFTPDDIAEINYPPPTEISNKGGIVGAYTAYYFYRFFGLGAFLFIGLSLLVYFKQKKGMERFSYLCGATFVQLSTVSLLALQFVITPAAIGLQSVMTSCGGYLGHSVSGLLSRYFGGIGATIISALVFLGSLSLMLERGLEPIINTFIKLWQWSRTAFAFISAQIMMGAAKLDEIRKRIRSRRNEEAEREHEADKYTSPDPPIAKPETQITITAADTRSAFSNSARPELTGRAQYPMPKLHESTANVVKKILPYEQPPIDIFNNRIERLHEVSKQEMELRRKMIISALEEFGVHVKVVQYEEGPTVTLYELELAPGTRISEVSKLTDELSMKLMVPNIRIIAPLPGKGTVGVEVPNPFPNTVRIREFLEKFGKNLRKTPLPLLLGKTNVGEPLIKNLTEMPHLLIAGTTGSGKSICLKSLIAGLVSLKSYDELKLFLIDPKMVELTVFEDIPHLWSPVITDARRATYVLDWLIKEMDDRYSLFNKLRVMKIETFNQLGKAEIEARLKENGFMDEDIQKISPFMPYVVIAIDELADLMLSSGKEVENTIIRLSQKARAVGIHIIAATQRPSTDVVTGLIKSNMPARASFKVASQIESRIILDTKGAERLLGKGDMLFTMPGVLTPIRAQCTYVDEDELNKLVRYLKGLGEPTYKEDLLEINSDQEWEGTENDEMFDEACRVVIESKRGSVSLIQRKLQIGYQRAARMIECMERMGLVGPYNGAKAREVYMTMQEFEEKRKTTQNS